MLSPTPSGLGLVGLMGSQGYPHAPSCVHCIHVRTRGLFRENSLGARPLLMSLPPIQRRGHRVSNPHDPTRVGTWNLAGRWSGIHAAKMTDADCDVWLLAEVSHRMQLPGYTIHTTQLDMTEGRHWAAIAARENLSLMARVPDPHPASVAVNVGAVTYCASVLPWRSCGTGPLWTGRTVASKTVAVTQSLVERLPHGNTVWGGDWNHAFRGPETAGSLEGRRAITDALSALGATLATADLAHRLDGQFTIDHVSLPSDARVLKAERAPTVDRDSQLSDHDAYVVEFDLPHRRSVYVIEVLGLGPNHVYVGESHHPPEVRRQKHAEGIMPGQVFRRAGHRVGPLRQELLPSLPPLTTEQASREAEGRVAELLRRQGYTVHGGH